MKIHERSRAGRRLARLAVAALLLSGMVAACGSDDESSDAASTETESSSGASVEMSDTVAPTEAPESTDAPATVPEGSAPREVNGIPIPDDIGTIEDLQPMSTFCGDKPMKIAYVDSWASVNAWRPITKAELTDEANKCPNVTEIVYTDGQGTLEKTISDIQGLIAQDVDLMVVMSDFGNQTIPAMRQAMDAGIPVVAINFSDPEGVEGEDFTTVINAADQFDARVRTQWLIDNRPADTCNILHIGGSPGNPLSSAVYKGVADGVEANPECTLLNDGEPLTTNWNPADEQQAVAGALVQFPVIDGIMNECGTCASGGWTAFEQAGRPLVPWASDDTNELACRFYELKPDNPDFEWLSFSARNWLSRAALHKAVAEFQGIENTEPTLFSLSSFSDSTDPDAQPVCVEGAPPTAIWSSTLTDEQVIAAIEG